ncbi:conserved exported hypothetical protein [Vibrio chagasii]|nr:conserved exported hypothetical protein [Vibrio chagasii]CAH6948188.1 conserved exported hypothetical protein [Vibrio chagasii]CAH7121859.1 conserved exported hypothetical protein [Vibrio chagasii]
MKYTKRSLVGLFTLLIIPTWGAQAANNAPYPFGEEFVYHTCPSGFDKQGMSCLKPASLKCDTGYSMSSNKQSCTKRLTQNLSSRCPSGYSDISDYRFPRIRGGARAGYCKKKLVERDSSGSSSYTYYGGSVLVFWKGSAKLSALKSTDTTYGLKGNDNWFYYRGGRNEVVRAKYAHKKKISYCPSGYTKSGSTCKKTVTKPVVKHCPSGSLNNGRCIVSPLRHSPIEETMATLYPRYSNDAEQQNVAAFRYLDNMFTLDPELGDIVSTMSSEGLGQDFSKLWANAEKSTVDEALEMVEGFAALQPHLPYLEDMLFDIYYDRAAAEFILANRSIDQARIDWVNDADVSVTSLERSRQNAVDILQRSLNEYWSLIDNHPQAYMRMVQKRPLHSARYLNGQGQYSPIFEGEHLVEEYKDALLVYQMMNTLLEQQVHLSKLKAVYANAGAMKGLGAEAEILLNGLASKAAQLDQLLGSGAKVSSLLASEQVKFNSYSIQLRAVIQWLNGDGNYLGLPDDFVPFFVDATVPGNTVYDPFYALKNTLEGAEGIVNKAKESFRRAKDASTNYKYQRDRFRQTFANEQQALNNQLFKLLGCRSEQSDNLCLGQTEAQRKGSLIAQQQRSIKAAKLGVERAQKARQTIEGNITIEMERLEQEKQVYDAIDKIMVQFGQNELSLSQLLKAERNGESTGKAYVDISELLKQEDLETLDDFVTETGNVDLSSVQAALVSLKEALKDVPRDDAIKYTQTLAALERATIRGLERELLDINTRARIRALVLELKSAEVDIAKSMTYLAYEVERLVGLSAEAERLIAQLSQNQQQQAERYYANPVHYSVLTKGALEAEFAYAELQLWLFYAVQALEYKWQEPFKNEQKSLDKQSIFKIQGIDQLIDYYHALVVFDSERKTKLNFKATDKLSLKTDIFGYEDKRGKETLFYPALDGSGEMLTADEAFTAKLTQLVKSSGDNRWVTVEFSTVKELPFSTFFQGPVAASKEDPTCLLYGGSYLDKIDGVSVNVLLNYDISGLPETKAFLTYGGNSYMRSSKPGQLTADGTGIKDELIAYSTRFWKKSIDGLWSSKSSFKQSMKANLFTDSGYDSSGWRFLNPTYSFNERSVAASGWRLSIQLSSNFGEAVEVEAIDDIELIVKHNFFTRDYDECDGGSGPLLRLR